KDRPFEQVWDDLDASYHQLLKRLEVSHAEALFDPGHYRWMKGKPFVQYIEGDSSEHYAEHAAHIREWRRRLANEQSSSGNDR
ncbi:MAG TPA: ClbS/DfsB family four-helix bundle protein, partial [Anaerolineae bacterium]